MQCPHCACRNLETQLRLFLRFGLQSALIRIKLVFFWHSVDAAFLPAEGVRYHCVITSRYFSCLLLASYGKQGSNQSVYDAFANIFFYFLTGPARYRDYCHSVGFSVGVITCRQHSFYNCYGEQFICFYYINISVLQGFLSLRKAIYFLHVKMRYFYV